MNYWSNLALKTFDYLSIPSLRDELYAVATALIGGYYVVPSGGGGGGNESDLRWDGRRPDEPDFAFQRRCASSTKTISAILLGSGSYRFVFSFTIECAFKNDVGF